MFHHFFYEKMELSHGFVHIVNFGMIQIYLFGNILTLIIILIIAKIAKNYVGPPEPIRPNGLNSFLDVRPQDL